MARPTCNYHNDSLLLVVVACALCTAGFVAADGTDRKNKFMKLEQSTPVRVNCAKELQKTNFTALWYQERPYAYVESNGGNSTLSDIGGIVAQQLQTILHECCAEAIDDSFFYIQYADTIENQSVSSLIQRELIYGEAAFGFPLSTPLRPNLAQHFVGIVPSPGAVYLVENSYAPASILTAVSGAWVLLCFVLASALLVGTLIWVVENHDIKRSMFSHNFFSGIYDGFWFSIVTMTTVGFGDITPRSRLGKFLVLLWMVVGTISLALFTATITTSLTTSTLNVDTQLRGARVAVIAQSEASKLAILNGAKVAVEALTAEEAIRAVLNKSCEGVVMDQLVAGDLMISSSGDREIEKLRLAKLLMSQVTYGVLFSPNRTSFLLEQCADLVMADQEHSAYVQVEELIAGLQSRDSSPSPSASTASIFSQHKDLIYYTCYALVFVLLFAAFIHQFRLKVTYPARKKRHNQRREPASASRQSRISAPPRSANGKSASSQALSQEKTRLLTSDGMSQYGSTQVTQYTRGNATHNGVSRKRATLAYEEARNWSPMNNPLLSDGEQTVGAINDDVRPDRPSSSSAVDEVVRRRQSQQREALSSNSCKSVSSSREMSPVAIAPKQQIYMRQAKMDNTVSAATSLESLSVAPETFPPPPPSRDGFGDLESLVLSEQGHELERMENDFQQMLHTWSARRRELMRRHQQERTNVRQRQQQQQESESR